MIRFALPLVLLTVGGCVHQATPQTLPGKCVASGLERLVGLARSETVQAEAKRASGAQSVRWINPGDMVTKDFREDRLNLELDDGGKISRAYCG
jgi:hypothetical protein